jgi:hypothetical protein
MEDRAVADAEGEPRHACVVQGRRVARRRGLLAAEGEHVAGVFEACRRNAVVAERR